MLRRLASYRDIGFALAIAVLGEAELFAGERYNGKPVWPGPVWLNAMMIVAMTAPVAWRRSRPLLSVALVFGIGTASSLTLGAPEAATAFVLLIATTFAGAAYSRHWIVTAVCVGVLDVAHAVNDPSSEGAGDQFWVFGLAGISLLIGRAVYVRQHRIGTLERDAEIAEARHAQQVAEATAAERSAIAREMHDLVSHAVSVIVIQAQAGARALPDQPDTATTALHHIEASARTAMTELRRLLVLLDVGEPAATSPTVSVAQLPELLEHCRSAGLQLRADLPARWPDVAPSTDAAAYHVVREALTNAMRHAPGARAELIVDAGPDAVTITVTNTGAPGSVRPERGAGRGLIGMRERVELVGGVLEVGPEGSGFRVHARLPATPDAARRSPLPVQ